LQEQRRSRNGLGLSGPIAAYETEYSGKDGKRISGLAISHATITSKEHPGKNAEQSYGVIRTDYAERNEKNRYLFAFPQGKGEWTLKNALS
jgi:hypothetical protein